jgi:menaquinone-dependent protoporphyrinogen oxidase
MKALVTAASKHGGTLEIAATIARILDEHGVSAELVDIDRARNLDSYGEPPVADDPNALRAGLVDRLVETTNAREHKLFAGKLDTSKLGLLEKAAVRGAHASECDYRDRDEVERWATEIAAELNAERTDETAPRARSVIVRSFDRWRH